MTDQFDERARELLRPIFPADRPDTPLSITMRDTIAAALRATAEAARREALEAAVEIADQIAAVYGKVERQEEDNGGSLEVIEGCRGRRRIAQGIASRIRALAEPPADAKGDRDE